jgi:hypothetical protein
MRGEERTVAVRVQPSADVDERAVLGDGTSVWHLAQVWLEALQPVGQ